MSNPVLICLNLDKFGLPTGWRRGVKPDGASEDIETGTQYSLILLGDQDQLAELSFLCNRDQATLGVEHVSRPILDERKARLAEICGRYERAYTFSHVEHNDIFELMLAFFRAADGTQKRKAVTAIVAFIAALDRWNGLVQFLMNKQVGFLGGNRIDILELPRSAVEFHNKKEEGASYTTIIADFISSLPA